MPRSANSRSTGGCAASAASSRSPRVRAGSDLERLLCPPDSAAEAALAGIEPVPVRHLADAVAYLRGELEPDPSPAPSRSAPRCRPPDLADVRGQERARRALELAAAGGHNLLLGGPPGTGKTMLARRLPGILPPLAPSGVRGDAHPLGRRAPAAGSTRSSREPPFRAPHHSASTAAIVGGGPASARARRASRTTASCSSTSSPSSRPALEALRQPLEDGFVSVARAAGRVVFPARFQLVGTMNLWPCANTSESLFAGESCSPNA